MLEVGWSEILVIAMVLIIVVGPKDLPGMLRNFGKMATRVRSMANDFKGQFDQAMREAELEDVSKTIGDVRKLNPTNSLRDAINPIRQLGQDIKSDLQKASDFNKTPVTDQGTKLEDLTSDPVEPAKPDTTASALPPAAMPPAAAMPVVSPATSEAKPKTSRKKADAALQATADALTARPVAVERVDGTAAKTPKKPGTKKAADKTEPTADPFPPPAKKVVTRKAPEKHIEHNVHVVMPDATASTEPAKKPARKKTVKAGDA